MLWGATIVALLLARAVVELRRRGRREEALMRTVREANARAAAAEAGLAEARQMHLMSIREARRQEIRLRSVGERLVPRWPDSVPPPWYAELAAMRARYLEHLEASALLPPLYLSRDDVDAALLAAEED